MDNLTLYDRVCEVPKNAQKEFTNGRFKGTDINPMWRIKELTKEFGICGIGWYYEIVDRWTENGDNGKVCVFVTVNLYIKVDKEWSKPIQGTGGNMLINKFSSGYSTSDEAFKMALTDALSIACKALGIGADIWWKEEKTKYTRADKQQGLSKPIGVPIDKANLSDEKTRLIKQVTEGAKILGLKPTILEHYKVKSIEQMTLEQLKEAKKTLEKKGA